MAKILMKGNEAVGAAAIAAGCKFFFGYPITPQSEVPEYFSRELPKVGGTFVQAESEIAAINMIYGCAGTGTRCMTSSSSPGISLKQEGISYLAGAELPCVIVNMMRGGPGLGSIQPSQTDYFQSTRGGGNGDYRLLAYAPASIQEMTDLIIQGFDKADIYRTPVMIVGDGMLGQMMEPLEINAEKRSNLPPKDWAATGNPGNRPNNVINSLYLSAVELEAHNRHLIDKYKKITENETLVEEVNLDGELDLVFSAYGSVSRICKSAMEELTRKGYKVGMVRPITIWPYPYSSFEKLGNKVKDVLVVEMNQGQMIDDVKIGVAGRQNVHFYGRQGGVIPTTEEIVKVALDILEGKK